MTDVAGVYNVLYRYLFDRHRDLTLPTSFLIDAQGDIVKVYQGPVDPRAHRGRLQAHSSNRGSSGSPRRCPFQATPKPMILGATICPSARLSFSAAITIRPKASFRHALRDDPSSAEAHYGLGSVYLKQDKKRRSASQFRAGFEAHSQLSRHRSNAWNNLGLLARAKAARPRPSATFKKPSGSIPIIGSLSKTWATRIASRNAGMKRARRWNVPSQPGRRARGELQPGDGLCADRTTPIAPTNICRKP